MKSFIPVCVCLVAQACPILWDTMQCSPPGSSVHGNSPGGNSPGKSSAQVTMPSFRGSSQPRDWTQGSYIANRSREAPSKYGTSHEFLCHYYQFSSVQLLSRIWLFETPWTEAHQASHHQLLELVQMHVHRVTDATSSSVIHFSSCLQSFPAAGSFPMSQFFASGGQSIGPGQNSTKRIWPCIARPHTFSLFKSLFCYNHKFIAIQSLIQVQLFATAWTAACQASPSFTISWSLLKLMSIELMVLSNHLILCRPLLLLPSIFPSTKVFSNESALWIRRPKN